ncbi:MAG: Mor transcription activator family protein [Syntrophales bacterium]|nr:Mor transcription activator family protein [Syntrophales bacterium]
MSDLISEMAAEIPMESLPEDLQVVAEIFGKEGALQLAQRLGGMQIYIPKFEGLVRAPRNARIRAEFNGRNHRDLSRRYNLTETAIRNILGSERR